MNVRTQSATALGENTLIVRDAAKGLGRAIMKLEKPSSLMIVAKELDVNLDYFTRELTRHLLDLSFDCFGGKPIKVYVDKRFKTSPTFSYKEMLLKYPNYDKRLLFWDVDLCQQHPELIDCIITLGGDGTVLFTTWLFQKSQVPPVIPFHFGSLGFLTVFKTNEIESVLTRVLGCNSAGLRVNMRMRLSCTIWRTRNTDSIPTLNNGKSIYILPVEDIKIDDSDIGTKKSILILEQENSLKSYPKETFQILNDLVVDRGPSAYMSQLDLFVDDKPLTTVQADGLVVSTPTGSTAYSLAAGGSLAHPEVPSFLLTPICAHSLSFRPMLLPDSIELKIQVPYNSRNTAWASFDGRHRCELRQGDFIVVKLSRWPVPTVCSDDQSSDWFESLRRCLHWNERTRQLPFETEAKVVPGLDSVDQIPSLSVLAEDLFGDS
ncbi:ATP-NAD kinase-like domain-containing protein [Globomyces pollinis-pini]|nr:ATP-NAD kinase-like domain-containing protein [Globomyces pollinis-pini]